MKTHKAKKSLGQNFLKSLPALKKIVETGEVSERNTILEIGPGRGALTAKLLETGATVIAIEKDKNLFEFLQEKFTKAVISKKLILVEDDCLNFNPQNFNLKSTNYKIIANIPYNITGAILKKFLTETHQPTLMVLLVQREVAQRIVANDGKESILSISVKAYGEPKMIMKVPARYFSPAPKVDSSVISIKNISREFFIKNNISEEKFWEIVHLGFAHKRKQLGGNLKNAVSKEKLANFGLLDSRAEDLTLLDWVKLIK